ncbi:hypothetical protein YPPY94_4632, partial [Yersinia pestis PY-94]|jgi:hypothetical protein
MAIL